MKFSLRIKLFLFVPVFALVPWLGYQTFQKLQYFATEAQSEALRVLAESLKPELDILNRPEAVVWNATSPSVYPVLARLDTSAHKFAARPNHPAHACDQAPFPLRVRGSSTDTGP